MRVDAFPAVSAVDEEISGFLGRHTTFTYPSKNHSHPHLVSRTRLTAAVHSLSLERGRRARAGASSRGARAFPARSDVARRTRSCETPSVSLATSAAKVKTGDGEARAVPPRTPSPPSESRVGVRGPRSSRCSATDARTTTERERGGRGSCFYGSFGFAASRSA